MISFYISFVSPEDAHIGLGFVLNQSKSLSREWNKIRLNNRFISSLLVFAAGEVKYTKFLKCLPSL